MQHEQNLTPAADAAATTAKYRFWLVFLCLVLSAFLSTLAIGALSAGDGMAHEMSGGAVREDFLTRYELLSFGLWLLAAGALYLGYKIRPGGN